MGSRVAAVDRLIAATLALGLVAGSLLVLAWRRGWPCAREVADRVDLGWFATAPQQRLWPAAMFLTAVVCLLGGLALLAGNLARHRIGPAVLAGADGGGALAVDLGALAAAVAEDVAQQVPGVVSARARAVLERGQPTIPLDIVIDPRTDLRAVVRMAEDTAHQVAHALDGADVAVRVMVACSRVH